MSTVKEYVFDPIRIEGGPVNSKPGFIIKTLEYYSDPKHLSKSQKASKKRARNDIEEEEVEVDTTISKNSLFSNIQLKHLNLPEKWITVADVRLHSDIPLKVTLTKLLEERMEGLEELDLEVNRCNIKFSNRQTFEVMVSFGQIKPLFELELDPVVEPILEAHSRFMKATLQSHKTDFHDVQKPILHLHLKKTHINNEVLLTYKLEYKIFVRESILYPYPVDGIRKLKNLSQFIFENDLTYWQKGSCDTKELETRFSDVTEAMFYDLITTNTKKTIYKKDSKSFELPHLKGKRLLGFQKETLDWMLNREGVELNEDGTKSSTIPFYNPAKFEDENDLLTKISKCLDTISFGWSRVRVKKFDPSSKPHYFWYNQYTGNVCSTETAISFLSQVPHPPAQGLLAEEMGLGKTIEVLSLILSNPRTNLSDLNPSKHDFFNNRLIRESKTTLIICPESILGQWKQEIEDVDTGLKVHIYTGIYNYEKTAERRSIILSPTEIAKKLGEYDIILVSYAVASREVHRATYNPETRPSRSCTSKIRFPMLEDTETQFDPVKNEQQKKRRRGEIDDPLIIGEEQDSNSYTKRDYSSPLMLVEFWRVVLDEVQMTSSISTNASKIARMIPRVHSWGVSGTLVKKDLNDLYSLLSFLRFYPIDIFSPVSQDSVWKGIITEKPLYKFIRLFKSICLRHTKRMVADQINIPNQSRIVLKAPFNPIERDNYDYLLNTFLYQIGLDTNGAPLSEEDWDPSKAYSHMRSWLTRLRRLCCHARIGSGASKKRQDDNGEEHEIGTLGDVLNDITENAKDEIFTNERAVISSSIKKGKIYEFLRQPDVALKVFEEAIETISKHLEETETDTTLTDVKRSSRLRSWYELMYQAYFLCASAHYQHYRPMGPIPTIFPDIDISQGELTNGEAQPEENPIPEEIDIEKLTPEEREHNALETKYYSLASGVVTKMLDESIKKIDEMVEKLDEKLNPLDTYSVENPIFEYVQGTKKDAPVEIYEISKEAILQVVPDIEKIDVVEEDYLRSLKVKQFYRSYKQTLDTLNRQATLLNAWITESTKLIKESVSNDENDATGSEYEKSLNDQSLLYDYMELIFEGLEDRSIVLTASDTRTFTKMKNSRPSRANMNHYDDTAPRQKLHSVKNAVLNVSTFDPDFSLRSLLNESRRLEDVLKKYETSNVMYATDIELIVDVHNLLKKEVKEQEKALQFAQKTILELMNDAFNAKIAYYRSLQRKSDSVKKYEPMVSYNQPHVTPSIRAKSDLESCNTEIELDRTRSKNASLRLKYLSTLFTNKAILDEDERSDEVVEEEKDRICVICRSTIIIGVLTSCGHQYCKECIELWIKKRPTCPMCSKSISSADMYSFTFKKSQLTGSLQDEDGENHSQEDSSTRKTEVQVTSVYKPLKENTLKEIQEISLVKDYGTKLEMIVRQVLWLKKQNEDVQILIYSQWSDFLRLVSIALRQNDIKCLGSKDVLTNEYGVGRPKRNTGDVEEFKRNPDITCFLLNAKAQAAGLTLVNASHVFLCESLVSLPLQLQAISRVHRLGQTKRTTVWMFVIEDTVDESIFIYSQKKRTELLKKSREAAHHDDDDDDDGSNKRGQIEELSDEKDADEEDDLVGVTELTKTTNRFVENTNSGGEVVENEELWASFFSHKSANLVKS